MFIVKENIFCDFLFFIVRFAFVDWAVLISGLTLDEHITYKGIIQ